MAKAISDKAESHGAEGFSLLETAIALLIMTVMTLATGSLYVYSINYNSGAADRAAALAIGQQRMEQIRRSSFNDSLLTYSTTETVTNAGRRYTLSTAICTTPDCGGSPTLKVITIQVTPAAAANRWSSSPVTLISQRATPMIGPYESN